MSTGIIKYKLVQRRVPGESTSDEKKWYPKSVQDRTVDFDGLVNHMSEHNSPYSRGVIKGVLTDMLDCVKELVLDGKSVRLGDLGLFSVGIKGKGALSVETFSVAQNVKGVTLNVRNTKTWSNAELRKNCSFQELDEYTTEEETTEVAA